MSKIHYFKYTGHPNGSTVDIYYDQQMNYFFSSYSTNSNPVFISNFDMLTNILNNKLKQGYNYRQLTISFNKDKTIQVDIVKTPTVSYENILFCITQNYEIFSLKHNSYIPFNDKIVQALKIIKEETDRYNNQNLLIEKIKDD
jgi:hypothetical protein